MSDPIDYKPRIRLITGINWLGMATCYYKEVQRFANVFTQTILAPIVTMGLFIIIFDVAMGRSVDLAIPYYDFLVPGLIMMALMQNAFANTSSSILHAKIMGTISDVIMTPLSPLELTIAYLLGGITRAFIVAGGTMLLFVPFLSHCACSIGIGLFYAFGGALIMSCLGMIGGIWARKFDQMATISNFIVTPLTFLSGTFYSVTQLPEPWRSVTAFNPFHYLIDGFRFALTAHHDTNLYAGAIVIFITGFALSFICWRMLSTGYRLTS